MITMNFPFAKLFKKPLKAVPDALVKQLFISFPEAKNVEWEFKNNIYEAIFYLNDIEHIAQISKKGELLEYKKNLWPDELPEIIKKAGKAHGEIMNGIIIRRGQETIYKMIIRNEKLDRYEFLFTKNGELLNHALL